MADLASAFSKILEIIKILEKMSEIRRFRHALDRNLLRHSSSVLCIQCEPCAKPLFSRKDRQDRKEDTRINIKASAT
jgi:hypothetical protein